MEKKIQPKLEEATRDIGSGAGEQILTLPTIDDIANLYEIANSKRTDESIAKWKKTYDLYAQKASSEEELESLLEFSHIVYGGIGSHGVDTPDSLEGIQDRLASILNEKIQKCTTIDGIRSIFDKLEGMAEKQGIGMTKARIAMENACLKWYELCTTKDDVEKMILATRTDIRKIVYAGYTAGSFRGI
jgi:hypothetical protein